MDTMITGKVLYLDKPNANGRIYDRESTLAAIEKFNNKPTKLSEFLPLERTIQVNLDNIGGVVTSLYVQDETVYAEVKVIDTINGKKVKELVSDVKLMFSLKGTVTLLPDETVTDLEIISIDVVPFDGDKIDRICSIGFE